MSTQNSSRAAAARRPSATRHTARVLRGLLVMLCGLALFVPLAAAQDDEVQVDPDSPSGREYALPVDSARSQAAKGSGTRRSAVQAAPLFGEGVRSGTGGGASDSAQADKTASQRGASDDADPDEDASSASRRAATANPETLRAQAAAPDGGGSLLVIIGVGAGVLLAGGLIGLALRRRATR